MIHAWRRVFCVGASRMRPTISPCTASGSISLPACLARLAHFDAVLMPTTPVTAPRLADLASDQAYSRTNVLTLRNPSIVNFLDGCAISIPCHEPGSAPVGLTIFALRGQDRRLLAIAQAVETCLSQ